MKVNKEYIKSYKEIIQTTDLQRGYQEFIKFFRYLRIYLEKEFKEYTFTGNIVENNMDYSYFQFTNKELKIKGLKIVIAFVHNKFNYEVWLSGFNRNIQNEYFNTLKNKHQNYILTNNPNRTDYILKANIIANYDYDNLDELLKEMKTSIAEFINDLKTLWVTLPKY